MRPTAPRYGRVGVKIDAWLVDGPAGPMDAEIPDTCSLTHSLACLLGNLHLGPRLVPRLRSSPMDLFSTDFCYGERWAQFRVACTTSVPIVLAEEGKLVPRRD